MLHFILILLHLCRPKAPSSVTVLAAEVNEVQVEPLLIMASRL